MIAWETKTLGDIAYLSGRIGWKGLTAKEYTAEGPLFLSVHSLNYSDFVDFRDAFHISQERYDESPEIMLQVNDVLICKDGAGIGKLGIVGDLPASATINSSLLLIRAFRGVDPKFLYHALCSPFFQKIVQERIDGATTPHLYQREIRQFPVPHPPLAEQRRIVGILDDAFAGLEVLRANAEKNLQNARALFESHLNDIFSQRGAAWQERPLGELASFRNGINFTQASRGELVRVVGVKEFQDNYWAPLDDLASVTSSGTLPEADLLKENDLLFVRSNGNIDLIGRCVLVGAVPNRITHSGFTIRARLNSSAIMPSYLCYFLKSSAARRKMIDGGIGTNIKSLNQMTLSALVIPFPTKEVQLGIVSKIEMRSAETQRLVAICQQKLIVISELKQSILQKAFAGELTMEASPVVINPISAGNRVDEKRATAMVLALAYERHKRQKREKTFKHVKAQKILHMVEGEAEFDLGRQPIRDVAGPNDFPQMLAAEKWAEANQYFRFPKKDEGGYRFEPLAKFGELIKAAHGIEPSIRTKIERVIDLFIPMDKQEAEVFATVYAAWNNLLIEKRTPTDDEIIRAAREDWHPSKLNIPRAEFVQALRLLKDKNCEPTGRGRLVQPPPQGRLPL